MSEKWDNHFLALAYCHGRLSKDPSTSVGTIIVGPDREIISGGFNGFPRGVEDTSLRLTNRDIKLKLIVHAELNAILAASRFGVALKGCTLYVVASSKETTLAWGGPPCTQCLCAIIQAGITEIVTLPPLNIPSRWQDDLVFARTIIEETHLRYREVVADVR
jgi:dCMP deaminase